LDDGASGSPFAADTGLLRPAPRSILCLPLVKHEAVVGLLYLENHLAPFVFTPRRSALMKLVAAQAAISIENARLHTSPVQARAEPGAVMAATSLGELAASIAHEVNQPLAAIVANAAGAGKLLTRDPPNLDSARSALAAITSDSKRAGEIITRIRGFLMRS